MEIQWNNNSNNNNNNNNNNTGTCKVHKVSSNNELEVSALARWAVLVGYVKSRS